MATRLSLSESKADVPAYVLVYEILYARIVDGEYKPGERLPSEIPLAQEMGISRGSLRQALAILREDGLIYNIQGKGNFVSEMSAKSLASLRTLDNPVYSCCLTEIERQDIIYKFEPTAVIVQKKMNLLPCDIALTCDAVYWDKTQPVAHAFYSIPVKFLNDPKLDMNNEEDVKEFLANGLYKAAANSMARITVSEAEENIARYLQTKEKEELLFIEDILYNRQGEGIALCKYYLLPRHYQVNVLRN